MKKLFLFTLLLGTCVLGNAQYSKVQINAPEKLIKTGTPVAPKPLEAKFIGFRNTPSLDLDWQPTVTSIVSKNESEYRQKLRLIKEAKKAVKQQTPAEEIQAKSTATAPIVSTNFIGLNSQGANTPLDNTIAVGNNGIVVAMVNSRIAYYNATGTQTYIQTIHDLINDNQISNNVCDPKVIYSSADDKFIMFAQTCDGVAASSAIILGFSKTNNPADGWYFYFFTGNPLQDGSWFDYPKIAVSTDEVFVSGNLFYEGAGFNTAVVYQIQKTPCFAGNTTNASFWSNLDGQPFTLLPVSLGHTGAYGPGIYMVASAGATAGSTQLALYDITNNIASGAAQVMSYAVNTTSYSVAADAPQPAGGKDLDVGDCRSLDGFFLDGIIHFVFNTDAGNSWNGINYNRLNVASATNQSAVYGEPGVSDNSFPSVASISSSATDKSVIIAYNRVSQNVNPETRVIKCDNGMTFSPSTLVKAGSSKIDHNWNSGSTERWGDYSGICRKYNDNPPSVWMAGSYGTTQQYWGTWIAKITENPVSVAEAATNDADAKVYPNPVVDNYYVEFNLPAKQVVNITITDVSGRLVKELFNGNATAGKSIFSFNKANLVAGTYFLTISSGKEKIKHEKIIIAE